MTQPATLEPPPAATPAKGTWRALPVLMAGTVIIVLDFFAVNVALPAMQNELHAGNSALEWVMAAYGLAFAALLVTAGRIGDRYGRRLTFCTGMALFAVASLLCAVAPSTTVLIGARLIQGAAAALISPSVLALLGVLYTGRDRARAISAYGVAMGIASAGGQLFGGVIIQANPAGLGWRAIFLVNIPVVVLALLAAPRLVPESRAGHAPAFDLAGTALVTTGLVALVLPLVQGRELGWPPWTWACLAAAPMLFGVFAAHQRWLEGKGGSPVLAPSLFRHHGLRAALVTQLAFWCGQAALFLILALYLQDGRHLDPLRAGLVFSILAASYLVTSLRAPALAVRHGRNVIATGALLLAAGEGLLAITIMTGGSFTVLATGLAVAGAGMGLCVTSLTSVVLAHAEAGQAGAVSGMLSTMQQAGNALGVAITGTIFFGALPGGIGHAFALSSIELACLLTVVAALTRLLPRTAVAR